MWLRQQSYLLGAEVVETAVKNLGAEVVETGNTSKNLSGSTSKW
jgi:hypothetical protein